MTKEPDTESLDLLLTAFINFMEQNSRETTQGVIAGLIQLFDKEYGEGIPFQ